MFEGNAHPICLVAGARPVIAVPHPAAAAVIRIRPLGVVVAVILVGPGGHCSADDRAADHSAGNPWTRTAPAPATTPATTAAPAPAATPPGIRRARRRHCRYAERCGQGDNSQNLFHGITSTCIRCLTDPRDLDSHLRVERQLNNAARLWPSFEVAKGLLSGLSCPLFSRLVMSTARCASCTA